MPLMEIKEHKKCDAIKQSGYWKGYPCCAIAKYEYKDKWYCGNHYAMAVNQKQTDPGGER